MGLKWKTLTLTAMLLTGCASGPNWQHTKIADKVTASRQLVIDDGNCTLVAEGGAPMPQVAPVDGPKTSDVLLRGTTYNSTTGTTTNSVYRGQVSTAPSGGFAGGFASGMASGASLGAAIAAQRAQERIHKSCMYAKGWVDAPELATTAVAPVVPQRVKRIAEPSPDVRIYMTRDDEWFADLEEFLRFHPAYKQPALYEVLRLQMVEVGRSEPNLSMPQRLLNAHDKIVGPALTADEKADAVLTVYLGAVSGVARDQAGLGLFYAQGKNTRTPTNTARSAYWSHKSALGGNAIGQMGLGIMLFSGGIQQDKVNGYLWVKKAGAAGVNVANTMRGFEEEMSAEQLEIVR